MRRNLIFGIVILITAAALLVQAATNINSTDRWGWNDGIGWIDHFITDTVVVSSQKIAGYASSSIGSIAFDCATTPNGDICGGAGGNWKVINNGLGNLSGWAWNDSIGWISFWCGNDPPGNNCASSNYRVTIDANGDFGSSIGNFAWNDAVGWICFNASTTGCGGLSWKVNTSWVATSTTGNLISSIFDSQAVDGAVPNSIMWIGSQPASTLVKFQIASGNSSGGPWTYLGPNGTVNDFYLAISGTPIKINLSNHLNHRYFRYKAILESDAAQSVTPRVEDIIFNWSP